MNFSVPVVLTQGQAYKNANLPKCKVAENGERRAEGGFPAALRGTARSSVTLQLDALPLGVSIISCAEPFVMQCVAGGN